MVSEKMNSVGRKQRLLKRLNNARWAWDIFQGPIYNRLISKAASEFYQGFVRKIQPPPNARILDIGSGPGFVTLLMAQQNPNASVVGIDYSPTQVRAANRLRERKQIRNCSFRHGDAMELPFEGASFDVIISVASIKHWPDAKKGLEEMRRVLVPEGSAFIAEADRNAPDEEVCWFASRFTAWYVWDWFMRFYIRKIVFGQSCTGEEAEAMAKAAGLTPVSVEKVPAWPLFLMRLKK